MKQSIPFFILIAFFVAILDANAQKVVSTAGGYFQNENISLSYTLGEPVVETFSSDSYTLTQGFQQPYSFYLQQILNIPMGWSGVSSYLDPVNKGVDGIFFTVENDLIILASLNGGIYYPGEGINTIGNWNYLDGYQIKASSDFELTVTGTKIPFRELDIDEGWNLVPVLSSCQADVENLFSNINGLQIVKEVAGSKIYWPDYGINTLGNLQAGKAYFLATEEAGTITYPECTKSAQISNPEQKPKNNTPWNDLSYSAISHVVAFPSAVFENSGIRNGDVIGVFTMDGLCAGRQVIQSTENNIALTVFGDDAHTTEQDGFAMAEPFTIKVFRPETGEIYELDVNYNSTLPQTGYYADHGLSAISSLKMEATGISEISDVSLEVYPNPSQGIFNIRMNKSLENPQIQITDFRGSLVKTLVQGALDKGTPMQVDLSGLPIGVYFLRLTDNGFVGMEKLVID